MPTALVTGPTGQDGSYLVEALLAAGWRVHGVVRRVDRTAGLSTSVTWHEVDLRAAQDLGRVVRTVLPDHVYNLAGVSSVARSWNEPELTTAVNAAAVTTLLEASWQVQEERGRPVHFLQASSAEIFGAAEQVPQTELTPLRPVNPYGATKAFAHHMVSVYRGRGLHASSCILYNHESPRRPESFVTRKITAAAARIARGEQDELVLGNLDARRDWGWAPDFVDAMLLAAGHERAGDYVVATGRDHSVRDFAAAAFAHAGIADWERHVRTDRDLVRPADAPVLVGDASRARRLLGWRPTMAFEDIVAAMVDADLRR